MENRQAIEKLEEVLTVMKTQHMMKSIDGELENGEVQMYRDRFEAVNMGIRALGSSDPDSSLKKAFARACRLISDELPCPLEAMGDNCPECETNGCDGSQWRCWQRYFRERVEEEPVCRVCGCTQNNACPGGCSWVEEDLCSCCADSLEKE